jgi:hypothetical protein
VIEKRRGRGWEVRRSWGWRGTRGDAGEGGVRRGLRACVPVPVPSPAEVVAGGAGRAPRGDGGVLGELLDAEGLLHAGPLGVALQQGGGGEGGRGVREGRNEEHCVFERLYRPNGTRFNLMLVHHDYLQLSASFDRP